MGRRITMTGKNVKYIEHRAADAMPDNDRDIRLEGDEAVYQEFSYGKSTQPKQEEKPSEDVTKKYQKDAVRKLLLDNAEYVKSIIEPEYAETIRHLSSNASALLVCLYVRVSLPLSKTTIWVHPPTLRWLKSRCSTITCSRSGIPIRHFSNLC